MKLTWSQPRWNGAAYKNKVGGPFFFNYSSLHDRWHPPVFERRWCRIQFVLSAPARVAKQANSRLTVSAAFAGDAC